MGKRSEFERRPKDFYPTPYAAVVPLLPYVSGEFIEPCAGDGRLVRHLEKHGLKCTYACDIEPMGEGIEAHDVLFFGSVLPTCQQIIINPPWERLPLHQMIEVFRNHAPTWLLFDASWAFTKQSVPFREFCSHILPVGRVSWMDNGEAGKDDCAWFRFVKDKTDTIFLP